MDGQDLDEIDADDEQYKTGFDDKDEDEGSVHYPFLERKGGEQAMYKSMQKTLKSDKDGDA